FLIVALLGLLALIGSALLVPGNLRQAAPARISEQFKVLTQPRLLLVYAMTAVGYGGTFVAFTYLAPILEQVSGFAPSSIGLIMLVYGVSVAVGNIWGGKLADRMGPIKALHIIFTALALVLLAFTFTAGNPISAVLTVLIWGAFAFGNVPGLQVYVVQLAEKYTPNAVDIAAGLNIAAFNVGIAIGSVMGGVIVEKMTLMDTPWIAAIIVVLALALTRLSGFLDSRDQTETTQVQWNSFLSAQRSPTQGNYEY
ncbi:MAG: MFS transporter, partial [Candidatus Competibacteraceae bacterium]|nr:MFS transporter [Candidatus Competibacteraceae bacterium]